MPDAGLQMDAAKVLALADVITIAGDGYDAIAPKLREVLPDIPEDMHGLRDAIDQFETARSTFDAVTSDTLQAAGFRLADKALLVAATDNNMATVMLPAAAGDDSTKGR